MTSTRNSRPQITLNMKQDFLLRALSDKRFQRRSKVALIDENDKVTRRVAFSAFDAAVLSCIVFHSNPKRGYSYIGCRAIAELMSRDPEQEGEQGWRTSPSGVAKSIDKLKLLGLLTEVGGNKKNKAQRLSPNWEFTSILPSTPMKKTIAFTPMKVTRMSTHMKEPRRPLPKK